MITFRKIVLLVVACGLAARAHAQTADEAPPDAADVAMCSPITDDRELQRSIREIVTTVI